MRHLNISIYCLIIFVFSCSSGEDTNDTINNPPEPAVLVAHYPFNGNSNDIVSGFDGTPFNVTLTADRKGNLESAYTFDGIQGYIDIQDNVILRADTGAKSFSLWFNLNSTSNNMPIITKYFNLTMKDWGIVVLNNKLAFSSENGEPNYHCQSDTDVITTGQWYFVVVVVNEPNVNLYLDGNLIKTCTNFVNRWIATEANVEIGHNGYGAAFFDGIIDDVRIFNGVLTNGEIQNLFTE